MWGSYGNTEEEETETAWSATAEDVLALLEQDDDDVWYWRENDGSFVAYSPEICEQLCAGDVATVIVGGQEYKVNPETMTQRNTLTGYERNIRRGGGLGEAFEADLADLEDAISNESDGEALSMVMSHVKELRAHRVRMEESGEEGAARVVNKLREMEKRLKGMIIRRRMADKGRYGGSKYSYGLDMEFARKIYADWDSLGIDRFELDRNGRENRDVPIRYETCNILLADSFYS